MNRSYRVDAPAMFAQTGNGMGEGLMHSHSHGASDATFAESSSAGVRALRIGVAGLAATAALQLVLLFLSGSIALLADTLHNGVDVAGTLVVWLSFVFVNRARSDRFGYGLHRLEDLAGLLVVCLIAGSAILVLYESLFAFSDHVDASRPWLVVLAGLVGFAGNEAVARYKLVVGRQIGSPALAADGQHSRTDGLTSLGVVAAGLGLAWGLPWLDAAVGLAIGLLIAVTAVEAGKSVFLQLADHGDPQLRDTLEHVAEQTEGVEHVTDLRVRHLGRTVHVVAHVCMPSTLSLVQAHEVAEELRASWLRVLPPQSVVDIHPDPFSPTQQGILHPADPEHRPT